MNNSSIIRSAVILAVLPSVVMFISLTGYFVHDKFQLLHNQLSSKGDILVQQIAHASEYAVFIKNSALLEDIAQPLLNESDFAFIDIYDNENKLLMSRKNLKLLEQFKPEDYELFRADIILQDIPLESSDFDLILTSNKTNSSQIIGKLVIGLTSEQILKKQLSSLAGALIIAVLCFLAALLFAFPAARSILRPLVSFNETLKFLKNGYFAARSHSKGSRELAALENEINALAEVMEINDRNSQNTISFLQAKSGDAIKESKSKSRFLANISKELMTPIDGSLQLLSLLEETSLTPKQRTTLEQTISTNKHLSRLALNLIDFSDIENNLLTLQQDVFSPVRIIKRAIGPFVLSCKEKNIHLNSFFDQGMDSLLVKADESRFQQIITNLIANSTVNTDSGYIDVNLTVEKSKSPEKILLKVDIKDTSKGYTSEQMEGLFDAFLKASKQDTKRFSVSGLGLAVAKKLIEAMRGSIEVNNIENQGCHYVLRLEFQQVKNANKQPAKSDIQSLESSSEEVQSLHAKVLLIEDNPINQMVTRSLLNHFGLSVESAINNKIAIEKLSVETFDLVVIDVDEHELPHINCMHSARSHSLHKNHSTPAVAMLNNKNSLSTSQLNELGITASAIKPVDRDNLWELIDLYIKPQV